MIYADSSGGMSGGLTMDGVQPRRMLDAFRRLDPALATRVREPCDWKPDGEPNVSPPKGYDVQPEARIRDLFKRYGPLDRMPRYVTPGPLAGNKRVAERLFLRTYDLQLEQGKVYRIWACREAAWTVNEWPESVVEIFQAQGEKGLRERPTVGRSIAGRIGSWLRCGLGGSE